jgi:CO/xanthine dehydrogenase FAD-binding subunit
VPIRLRQIEAMVGGARVTEKLLGEVAAATEQAVANPITDVQADGEYRQAMAGVMAKRALASAFERARHKGKGERR